MAKLSIKVEDGIREISINPEYLLSTGHEISLSFNTSHTTSQLDEGPTNADYTIFLGKYDYLNSPIDEIISELEAEKSTVGMYSDMIIVDQNSEPLYYYSAPILDYERINGGNIRSFDRPFIVQQSAYPKFSSKITSMFLAYGLLMTIKKYIIFHHCRPWFARSVHYFNELPRPDEALILKELWEK